MMSLDRRSFLIQGAAVPLVFGLESQGAAEPAWAAQALDRMKQTGRWGVVLALPPEKERFKFGQGLWALAAFDHEDHDAHQILCEAVFMVMPPELLQKRFGVKAPATRVLLSAEGKVLVSDTEDLEVVGNPERFADSFRRFIHGEGNARLIARAREIEPTLTPETREATSKLGSESNEDQLAAKLVLGRQAERLTIPLAHLAETAPGERTRQRARNLLTSYFASLPSTAPGSRLPFGADGPHHYDPCGGCGLGRIPDRSRMFLRFLVPGAPPPKQGS